MKFDHPSLPPNPYDPVLVDAKIDAKIGKLVDASKRKLPSRIVRVMDNLWMAFIVVCSAQYGKWMFDYTDDRFRYTCKEFADWIGYCDGPLSWSERIHCERLGAYTTTLQETESVPVEVSAN